MFDIPFEAEFVVSLALLLLALAGLAFVGFEKRLYAGAPWPLSTVLGWITKVQAATLNVIKSWAIAGIGAASLVFLALFDVPRQLFDHLVATIEAIWTLGAKLRVVSTTLYHQALAYTHLVADGIAANVITTTHYLEGLVRSVTSYAHEGVAALEHSLVANLGNVYRTVAGDVASLSGSIDAGVHELAHGIEAGVGDAERYAAGAVAGAVGAIDGQLRDVTSGLVGSIDGVAKDLLGRIDAVEAGAAAGLSAGVAAILALIQTGVMATVATIGAEVDDCLRPNCSWMNALGSELGTLATDAMVLLLIGFLAEAVIDPGAAAIQAEDLLNPLADEIDRVMSAAVGYAYSGAYRTAA